MAKVSLQYLPTSSSGEKKKKKYIYSKFFTECSYAAYKIRPKKEKTTILKKTVEPVRHEIAPFPLLCRSEICLSSSDKKNEGLEEASTG